MEVVFRFLIIEVDEKRAVVGVRFSAAVTTSYKASWFVFFGTLGVVHDKSVLFGLIILEDDFFGGDDFGFSSLLLSFGGLLSKKFSGLIKKTSVVDMNEIARNPLREPEIIIICRVLIT